MTADFMPDTPVMARRYCPTCEPETDPTAEILDITWCTAHEPTRGGEEDARINTYAYLSGSGEVGGDENRAWCDLLHGRRR